MFGNNPETGFFRRGEASFCKERRSTPAGRERNARKLGERRRLGSLGDLIPLKFGNHYVASIPPLRRQHHREMCHRGPQISPGQARPVLEISSRHIHIFVST